MSITCKIVLVTEALTIFIFNEHNSIYQNVPQGRPSFKRNNSSISIDLKAIPQTTFQLNLTGFSAEVFSAIVLILLCVRIYPITCFLTRNGEKNNLFQYLSSMLNFLSGTEGRTSSIYNEMSYPFWQGKW